MLTVSVSTEVANQLEMKIQKRLDFISKDIANMLPKLGKVGQLEANQIQI